MSEFGQQFKQFWGELGINQRVSILLSCLGIFVVMGGILYVSSQPRMELLYGRLDSQDVPDVVAVIKKMNIPFEVQGSSIMVPSDKVASLRMEIASAGAITGGSVGYEIFDQNNFGISDYAQKTNGKRALQGELERSIETISGVRNARVLIVVPDNKLILDVNKSKPTASVVIDTGNRVLDNEQIVAIQRLVSHSVEGLQSGGVSVVDNVGNSLSDRVNEDGDFAQASSQIRYRQGLEEYFAQKVKTMLIPVVGEKNVVASVSVDVDMESKTRESDQFDPESKVVRTENIIKEKESSMEVQPDPIVGETPNTPVGLSGAVGSKPEKSQMNRQKDQKQNAYEISRVKEVIVRQPGKILGVTAAVYINELPPTIAADGTATPNSWSPAQIEKFREMVSNALGVDPHYQPGAVGAISITAMPFNGLPTAPIANTWLEIRDWLEGSGLKFIALGTAVLLFFVFMRMLSRHKPAIEQINMNFNDEDALIVSGNVSPRPTPELLNELIAQKPENVAQALKSWSSIK
jgi:flagellar M-ring protein FliF